MDTKYQLTESYGFSLNNSNNNNKKTRAFERELV